ncbi:MAG: acetylornithine/succinylornithine family transaminase [Akkermansiaceae bacterium]|nr:acetylornithine/succinylornithine family transaminase [Akkermansiaceae bacterium]
MNTNELYQQYVLPTYGRFPVVPVRGEGSWLWDEQGKRYLDFCSGIAVCSLGHSHPKLTEAIQEQAATLLHVSNLYQPPAQAKLAREIVKHQVGIPGKVFFSNSGAEANDGLIKSARRYGHERPDAEGKPRFEVLTFNQSFHGRTLGSMAATGQDKIKQGFDPMLPGFRHLPFNDAQALKQAIRSETVAILLEPIQGEGGIHVATPDFLQAIDSLCKQHDLLLFFDEVQAGFGRCGDAMAWRMIAPEIEPDGVSWAKGMGGGVPIGAFWLKDKPVGEGKALPSLMGPGSHGSTYGGNPLVSAASLVVLEEIREQNLGAYAKAMEVHIRKTIGDWKLPAITEVRGLGLLLGIGLDASKFDVPEGKTAALLVVTELMNRGLLCPPAGTETFRLLPPLTVSQEEVDEALAIIRDTLETLIS